jgi:hypothetical protein
MLYPSSNSERESDIILIFLVSYTSACGVSSVGRPRIGLRMAEASGSRATLQKVVAEDAQNHSEQGGDHAYPNYHIPPRAPPPNCGPDVIRAALRVAQCKGTAGMSSQMIIPDRPTIGFFLVRLF